VVGKGKAVVRVNAELDFRLMEKTEETYDPESPVVRSTQKQMDKAIGPAPPSSRLAGKTEESSGGSEKEKNEETVNYEINKTVSKTVMPTGEIKKISIAVLVDGIYQKNDKGAATYQERPKKELESFEDLVRKSAGFNPQRGDQVVVSSMPFNRPETEEGMAAPSWQEKIAPAIPMIKYAALIIGLLFTFLFIIRPLVRNVITTAHRFEANEQRQIASGAGVSVSLGSQGQTPQLALSQLDDKTMSEMALARQLAGADSKKFAELLRNWLK
jgi:flagellar M-ring protein FliF